MNGGSRPIHVDDARQMDGRYRCVEPAGLGDPAAKYELITAQFIASLLMAYFSI
jgi:hypothetical protein